MIGFESGAADRPASDACVYHLRLPFDTPDSTSSCIKSDFLRGVDRRACAAISLPFVVLELAHAFNSNPAGTRIAPSARLSSASDNKTSPESAVYCDCMVTCRHVATMVVFTRLSRHTTPLINRTFLWWHENGFTRIGSLAAPAIASVSVSDDFSEISRKRRST